MTRKVIRRKRVVRPVTVQEAFDYIAKNFPATMAYLKEH